MWILLIGEIETMFEEQNIDPNVLEESMFDTLCPDGSTVQYNTSGRCSVVY